MNKKIIFIIILLASTLACNLPILPQNVATATPLPVSFLMISPDPNATKTPTPFQPRLPTATASPTSVAIKPTTPLASKTAKPTNPVQTTQGPRPSGKYPDGQVRIMVLGSDSRSESVARTDIMMMISINPSSGSVTVLSFPRDLWVNIPGVGMNRINTAMVYGGFNLLAVTLDNNFGIRPNHFVLTTFQSFKSIVDSLGGIDVNVAVTLRDLCALPQAVRNFCTIPAGVNHMNGSTALWYVRSRYSTSDFERERRSQEVLQAIFQKMISLNMLAKIPQFYDIYKKNVMTSLTLQDVLSLAIVAPGVIANSSKIRRYTITPKDVYPYVVPGSGAQVLLPNKDRIQSIIQQAVFTP